ECLRLLDEEEKLGGSVSQKIRDGAKLGLSKARDLARDG
ncbi:MAG: hypothetical protein JWO31_2289, partial [Phycisphaerales bacterium]|nr:hypothetical protein [Phycisphaerales bacterium]